VTAATSTSSLGDYRIAHVAHRHWLTSHAAIEAARERSPWEMAVKFSCQSKKSGGGIGEKSDDISVMLVKHALDDRRRAISASDPDHLRWVTVQEAALMKVCILGDDVRAFCLAYSHTAMSSALASPMSRTCTESGYRSASKRTSREERFSSKISLTPSVSGSGNGN